MRPIISFALHSVLASAMAAFAASSATAGSDYYLKIGTIKGRVASTATACRGESCDDNSNSGWMEIHSFQFGKTLRPGVRVVVGDWDGDGKADMIASPASGAAQKSFVLPHVLEKGSLTVWASIPKCAQGEHIPNAIFATPYMRYEFKDVFITSCSVPALGASSNDRPMESVSFNYTKVRMVPVPEGADSRQEWSPPTK